MDQRRADAYSLAPRRELLSADANGRFVVAMAIGSVVGTLLGGLLLKVVPSLVRLVLVPFLILFAAGVCAQGPSARLSNSPGSPGGRTGADQRPPRVD